jgi:hypothetical protein
MYWSKDTLAVQPVVFGQPEKLINNSTFLNTLNVDPGTMLPTPNQVWSSRNVQTIQFSRIDILGNVVDIVSTEELKQGDPPQYLPLDIPTTPVESFFDITVTPDFQYPDKWKLELGKANVPAIETRDRILVSRATTDSSGILDLSTSRGTLDHAVVATQLPPTQLSHKYIEPISLNISLPGYLIVFSWFSVDASGNAERMQKAVFQAA